ncbi:MAG: acetyl-coenzyme A synthetase N-terminal domain-containing protein, partial [Gammaproteobacteria bacterium]
MSNAGSINDSVYPVKKDTDRDFLVDKDQYEKLYKQSVNDNETFWAEQAGSLDWTKPFTVTKDASFAKDDLHIRWFEDGELNVCVNCVDRHLADKADQTAIIFEGDHPDVSLH